MESESEDVYYTDIANLRAVLVAPGSSDEVNDGIDGFENDVSISDEESNDNATDDESESKTDLPHPYLDLDEIVLDTNAAPSPRTCRALGSACYDNLLLIKKQLSTQLEKCRTKIKDLQDRIDSTKNSSEKSLMTRSSWYYMFGIPYFKDRRYFPCPPNEDHLEKTANMELSIVDLPALRKWKGNDKGKLMAAIRAQEITNQIKEAESKKASALKTIDVDDPSKAAELESSLEDCNLACIKSKSLAELVGSNKSEYDWMKISVVDLEGLHSADECRAMWLNYLHPMIRKSKWTKDEDNKLKDLVVRYKNQNWNAIAQELGTQRSAYQCMFQFQTRLNDSLRKSKWTKEEDEYLKQIVEKCRIGLYIPWPKVTYYMNGRIKNQVFNRWTYSLDPSIKKGRFTKEEDILVVAAVRRYGTDFSRVARFLPGRTSTQVRDRYNSFLKHQNTAGPWKPDDDALLMALVEEHGEGNWSQICQHFVNRNRTQVRHRYSTLQSWMKKVSAGTGEMLPAPTRRLNLQDNREEKVWNSVQNILRDMKTSTEIDENNLMKLKEKLHLEARKRPGRKVGQRKVINALSKQYYTFFRCVYTQFGGRKKLRYDEDLVQSSGQVVCNMLKHFQAVLNIPNDDSVIEGDHLFQEIDKFILCYLRDRAKHVKTNEMLKQDETSNAPAKVSNVPIALPEARHTAQVANIPTTLLETPSFDMLDTTSRISYLCPPNHTTLVGFRTFLLSRRNVSADGDNAGCFKSSVNDTANSGGNSVTISDAISPEAAAALWRERIASLFVWPAVMSNTAPKIMDGLFQNDGTPVASASDGPSVASTGDGSEADNSDNGEAEVSEPKVNKKSTKKRKNKQKKKKVDDIAQPTKKRKYEKSGKFKKPTERGVLRRSTRNASVPESGL